MRKPRPGTYESVSFQDQTKYLGPTVIKAQVPTWRDVWAILRGRYAPKVIVSRKLTVAGVSRVIKRAWSKPRLEKQMKNSSPLLTALDSSPGVATIPLNREKKP